MKQILSTAFALALAGALLTGCDRPRDQAGAGGTSAGQSSSGSASGSAGTSGSAGSSQQQKKPGSTSPSPSTPPASK